MSVNMAKELAALGRMTVKQLREKHVEVFGEATRSGNKDYLRKRIAWRIQANAHGDLSERARRRAEELANDADLRTTAPKVKADQVAITRDLGLTTTDTVLTGQDLDKMTVEALSARIREVFVFARVSPKHKMLIIDALQAQHEIVSMTGDGVNDAPALKSADIGVAMGITGTDVSKESSDMVLLDDNFATIVAAVKEGRRIYDNIRKFVRYILTGNAGEIVVMLAGPLVGMPLPLLPIQILWINLVTDGLPAVALGFEEAENDVMNRPPTNPRENIFARGLGWQILVMGLIVGLISVGTGYWFWDGGTGSNAWQTMVFTMLTFCQMAYALCVRKQTQSLFTYSWFSNPMLLLAIGATLTLQMILIYVPFFNTVFRTTPLQPAELGICAAGALVIILITESKKLFLRSKRH